MEQKKLLSARIVKVISNFVYCEYVKYVNEKPVYKVRKFPKIIFEHIPNLQEGKFIEIKISLKPGASKIEIQDGRGPGIELDFEQKDLWKGLENMKIDDPPKRK